MRDLLFLIPLFLGLVIMVLGAKLLKPHESRIRGIAFAISLIVGAICWALASAINLVWDRTFYVALDVLTICIFFVGCLLFLPRRTRPGTSKWWLDPAILFVVGGLLLGVAHGCAMVLSDTYAARLIACYRTLGITATKPQVQPAPPSPEPRTIPKPSPFPKNLNPPPPR